MDAIASLKLPKGGLIHTNVRIICGAVIKHGWLNKKGEKNKTWKQRYFVLNKRTLKYFEDFEQTNYLGTINLNTVLYVNEDAQHRSEIQIHF